MRTTRFQAVEAPPPRPSEWSLPTLPPQTSHSRRQPLEELSAAEEIARRKEECFPFGCFSPKEKGLECLKKYAECQGALLMFVF